MEDEKEIVAEAINEAGTDDFDMDAALDTVSEGLGLGTEEPPKEEPEADEVALEELPAEAEARAAPKAWAKEQHETWGKLPPEAQDYIERREKQMLEGITEYKQYADFGRNIESTVKPFERMFQDANLDFNTGIGYLLNAQAKLQYGTPEQKTAELNRIAHTFGIPFNGEQPVIDPQVKALQDQIQQIQSGLTQRQQQEYQQVQKKTLAEVEAFSQDAAHPYFDEVADDIVAMIKTGADLQTAYEKAVWANPVTRQKEIARLNKENVASLREKAKQETEAARKATGSNVRTRDTNKSPTEAKGKLFGEEHQAEMLAIAARK